MTAREAQLEKQLAECQAALAVALRENQLLRQKVDLGETDLGFEQ